MSNRKAPLTLTIGVLSLRLEPSARVPLAAMFREGASLEALWEGQGNDALMRALGAEIQREKADGAVRAALEEGDRQGVRAVVLGEAEYPPLLAAIPDPPLVVFYRGGDLSVLANVSTLAIVGSRQASSEGCRTAATMAAAAARSGCCIVSGLALGVDGAAHRGSLVAGARLPTVAVLANGLPAVYPSSHRSLADEILVAGGLLLSQFPTGTPPYPVNFLNRNRIIAGLSRATVVIEAPARSGALVTARHALEQGREVLAVPGSVHDLRYAGSHRLLQQGAYLVTSFDDVADLLPELRAWDAASLVRSSVESGVLPPAVEHLISEAGEISLDVLEAAVLREGLARTVLLELELDGRLVRLPGNRVRWRAG